MIHQGIEFLKYKSIARNKHGIQAPFLFDLYTNIISDTTPFYCFEDIESIRAKLLLTHKEINVTDLGAGSKTQLSTKRKISQIAKSSLKAAKYSQLLFRLVNYFKPNTIVELGTSLGISTMYLASPNSTTQIHTIEGCPKIAHIAQIGFEKLHLKNIHSHIGPFDDILPQLIKEQSELPFVFFDGNHQKKPTLNYFESCLKKVTSKSIFVFDDIHWSKEMTEAWKIICKNPKVTLSIDLFELGIVFFDPALSKEHFVLKF